MTVGYPLVQVRSMKQHALLICTVYTMFPILACVAQDTADDRQPLSSEGVNRSYGEWPTFRGNHSRTNRATLKGDITQPAIRWNKYVGLWEMVATLAGGDSIQQFSFGGRSETPDADLVKLHAQWECGEPWYDVTGNGHKRQFEVRQDKGIVSSKNSVPIAWQGFTSFAA